MSEHPYRVETCGSCRRPIIWAITEKKLRRMPVDAEPPSKGGNVELIPRKGIAAPIAKVLNVTQQFGRTNLRTSHFATCPNAAAHRTAGRRQPA